MTLMRSNGREGASQYSEALREVLMRTHETQSSLAGLVGLTRQAINGYVTGARVPDPATSQAIELALVERLGVLSREVGGAPACGALFADGAKTTEEFIDALCRDGEELRVPGAMDVECADGRRLLWNDEGWGYLGEAWHVHDDDGAKVAPAAEREACKP